MGLQAGDSVHIVAFTDEKYIVKTLPKKNYQLNQLFILNHESFFDETTPIPLFGCFLKWWYPQIIHFKRDFQYKPSILG